MIKAKLLKQDQIVDGNNYSYMWEIFKICFSSELTVSEPQESGKDDILQPGSSGERSQYLLRATCIKFLFYYIIIVSQLHTDLD